MPQQPSLLLRTQQGVTTFNSTAAARHSDFPDTHGFAEQLNNCDQDSIQ
jgi:hypothetical protein